MINNKIVGLLGLATKAGVIIAGTDASIECIESKKAKLVLISEEASEKTKKNFEFICNKNFIPIVIWGSIETLSKAIGKNNKAIICIRDKNFAGEIYKLIYGREIV